MDGTSFPPGRGIHQETHGNNNIQAAAGSMVFVFQSAPPKPVDPAELAAADAHFAQIPLDALPDPAGLPPGSVMPWQRNRFFTGREPDLRALARHLKESGSAAVGQSPAVTGLGGQGKTQLAVEFAYRYGPWFRGGVFFVNCADPAAMAEAVAACGLALGPDPGFSGLPLPERVARVGAAWASPLPRLLIFDNCEEEGLIEDWAPRGGGCRLLITARRPSWFQDRGITALPLGQLTPSESLTLLRRHRPDLPTDDPSLIAIAEELGALPLALELAGSYLARYRDEALGMPAAYLAELRDSDPLAHASMTIADPDSGEAPRTLTGHERDVARTFAVSLRRLDPDDPKDALARHLLACAAWLAPGLPIPRFLLKLCAGLDDADANATRHFADALTRLLDLALAERAEEAGGPVVLHRLVAAFARSRLDPDGSVRAAVEAGLTCIANRSRQEHDLRPFHGWASHLLAVAGAAARDQTDAAVGLLHAAGIYNLFIANFDASVTMLRDAAVRAEAAYGPSHPEAARILGNLGIVQQERGNLDEAVASLTRVLTIMEAANGPGHPDVARALGNLGTMQQDRGDLDEALASLSRALAIKEAVYGSDHPQVACTLTNLGNVQRERGDLDGALASKVCALAIQEKTYGPDHPEVARSLGSLGIIQRERGDLDGALASQTRALAIQEKAYGPDHPEVASILGSLGTLHRASGRIAQAKQCYECALTIFAARLGDKHRYTIRTRRLFSELESLMEN